MVSFHCDGCTDIVKKPKLDRHYAQCRSPFTCIDCSKTFKGPAEWKAHTSCVTEAEKYQKSTYVGPKKGPRPYSGRQTNSTPRTMNAPGKYHRSSTTQLDRSRPQYIRNCASGANSTPLGSPHRMSPVDSPAVEPTLSTAKAASTTECEENKKQDSEAVSHTLNGTGPKEKKTKRKRDIPRGHNVKDATPNEQPVNADVSYEKHKGGEKSEDDPQSKTQPSTEDISQSSGDKKVKKKKKEKKEAQPKQGDANEENVAPPEPVVPPADDYSKDEKKSKKRKHKEKREEEAAAEPESLSSQTDGTEKKRKKKKDVGGDQTAGEKRKREDGTVNDGEKKRKKQRSDV